MPRTRRLPSVPAKRPSKVSRTDRSVIPCPSPDILSKLQSARCTLSAFLGAAGIKCKSQKHTELTATIRALWSVYLGPFKHAEEQPSSVDQLIAQAKIRLPWLSEYEDCWPARVYLVRYTRAKTRPKLDHRQRDRDSIVKEFLGSLTPGLEHHLDAFVKLGIKDQKTLQAFVSWPQVAQAQFLDEAFGVLPLTTLEKKGLLAGCSLLTCKVLGRSLKDVVESRWFRSLKL